jgi:hypothetical protein
MLGGCLVGVSQLVNQRNRFLGPVADGRDPAATVEIQQPLFLLAAGPPSMAAYELSRH